MSATNTNHGRQQWIVCSSSSGQTYAQVWQALSREAQQCFRGAFVDRECGTVQVFEHTHGPDLTHVFSRKTFESSLLQWIAREKFQGVIFLCGFFKILSAEFIQSCGCAIVNTHPSLLPSFPGLDIGVHEMAAKTVAVSGFTLHMVDASVDGGPVIFQHPVSLLGAGSAEDVRHRVRESEQRWLGPVFDALLSSKISAEDRSLDSLTLRQKLHIQLKTFEEVRGP